MSKKLLFFAVAVSLLTTASIYGIENYYSNGFPFGEPWAVLAFLAATSFSTVVAAGAGFAKLPSNKFAGLGVLILGIISLMAWITLFNDQLPCFLGGLGC
jgi:hypothetical protein